MIKVKSFVYHSLDELMANTYVIYDDHRHAFIVDPSCNYDGVINFIKDNKLKPLGILLTHNHFDHIKGVNRLIKAFDIPIYIHEEDYEGLYDPDLNFSSENDMSVVISTPAIKITDYQIIKGLEEDILVIHTPFHTGGSVCYYLDNNKMLFSGDTLFYMSIGRNDFSTSEPKKTKDSLKKLFALKDDVNVYPGHGINTSIGHERNKNPFITR